MNDDSPILLGWAVCKLPKAYHPWVLKLNNETRVKQCEERRKKKKEQIVKEREQERLDFKRVWVWVREQAELRRRRLGKFATTRPTEMFDSTAARPQ